MNCPGSIDLWRDLSKRFSLIPLHGKRPFENGWQIYCSEKREFKPEDFTGCNAGVACGPASGCLVIDIDHPEKFKKLRKKNGWELPPTFTVKTGSGKYHLYFKYPSDGKRYANTSIKDPENGKDAEGKKITVFDVRGIGGQVVAPGSIHPDTKTYYTIFNDCKLASAPKWLLELCLEDDLENRVYDASRFVDHSWDGTIDSLPISDNTKRFIFEGVDKGERSEAIMSVTNALVWSGLSDDQIVSIFDQHPIGEKYREKGKGRHKWIEKHLAKARQRVTEIYDWDKRSDLWQLLSSRGDNGGQHGTVGFCGDTRGTIGGQLGDNMGDNPGTVGGQSVDSDGTSGLAAHVEVYLSNFTGSFTTKDITEFIGAHYGIDRLPRTHQKALAKVLARHVESGRLERTFRGGYRIIDTSLEDLDQGVGEAEYPINLPLNLNELVYVEPKEVILVAGNTDGGKTCFAFQVGFLNGGALVPPNVNPHTYKAFKNSKDYANYCGQGGFHVFHFVSEMGGVSFRHKFDMIGGEKAYNHYRSNVRVLKFKPASIADQIQPNSINIIDYLEPPHGDFREVVPTINAIFDKLVNGVAVICVQMRQENPVGGYGALWKPRLAVKLSDCRDRACKMATIMKGKNTRSDGGVDGWEMDYWCINKGVVFQHLSDWESPYGRNRKKYCKI